MRHLMEEKTRFAPTIHGMLTVFTFHRNDARQRAVAIFLVTVKPAFLGANPAFLSDRFQKT